MCALGFLLGTILIFWPEKKAGPAGQKETARWLPPRFIGLVSDSVDQNVHAQIRTFEQSAEAIEFGKQLEVSLAAAGWHVRNFGESAGVMHFRGTRIEVAKSHVPNAAAVRLCNALNQVGIAADVMSSGPEAWGPDFIRVSIGAFPD